MSSNFRVVDRAGKDFTRILCLSSDVPTSVAKADFGPADHSRAQGPETLSGPWHTSSTIRR